VVTNWRVGETIPIGRDRTLRVVGIVVSNEDEPSVLIVEIPLASSTGCRSARCRFSTSIASIRSTSLNGRTITGTSFSRLRAEIEENDDDEDV
jgi:hypothetical protein